MSTQQLIISDDALALCEEIGGIGLRLQESSGALPSGRNGPHNHNMTPVRNTGHWSILFGYLFQKTGDVVWRKACEKALDYIISKDGQPLGGAFHHRQQHFKCSYNGLIGQSWSLEALCYGSHALGTAHYLKVAQSVSNMHKFDHKTALWHELDLDGSLRPIGKTLNQQIWFTAMSLYAHNNHDMVTIASRFLDRFWFHARLRKSGLFYTAIYHPPPSHFYRLIKKVGRQIGNMLHPDKRLVIDAGYHIFTLLGLTHIKTFIPSHPFFNTKYFKHALSFAFTKQYARLLTENPYGFRYNVPGFEMPVVWRAFKNHLPDGTQDFAVDLYMKQLVFYSQAELNIVNKIDFDFDTFMARFYEITRLNNTFWQRDEGA